MFCTARAPKRRPCFETNNAASPAGASAARGFVHARIASRACRPTGTMRVLLPFAGDTHGFVGQINVVHIEADEFRQTQAGGI